MNVDLTRVQKIIEWAKTQIFLDAKSSSAKSRLVKRGQVYRCNFGCGIGSEMQKERPAVIIQNNPSNKSSGNTIAIPITHDQTTMSCMAPITTQYDDKIKYIEVIKKARNESQDKLFAICTELNLQSDSDILTSIKEFKSLSESHNSN